MEDERRLCKLRERQQNHERELWKEKLQEKLRVAEKKLEMEKTAVSSTTKLPKLKMTPFKGTAGDWHGRSAVIAGMQGGETHFTRTEHKIEMAQFGSYLPNISASRNRRQNIIAFEPTSRHEDKIVRIKYKQSQTDCAAQIAFIRSKHAATATNSPKSTPNVIGYCSLCAHGIGVQALDQSSVENAHDLL
ncbi:hypothetical protein ACROYT_G001230 [Oculina patagonica]